MRHDILETFKADADYWKIDPSYAWKQLKSKDEPEEAPEEEAPPEDAPESRFSTPVDENES